VSPSSKIVRFLLAATLTASIVFAACGPLAAQDPSGPLAPPRQPDIVRIPSNPTPDKPPIPAEEMIRQLAAHQDEAAQAREGYIYKKTVQLQEMGSDGKPSGQVQVTTEYKAADDGTVRPRTVRNPDSGLQIPDVDLDPDSLQMLSAIPAFPFTTSQLSKYVLTYQTSESVDDLMTYVFQVSPKQLDRDHAYFSGLIWVDDHDLAIVKSYGKWVSETGDRRPSTLPFTMFETYGQPVANKYWMPAYSRSDGFVKLQGGSVPVRLIIRWDDYKPAPKPASAPASAPSR
jgi:hypothetical protein